MATILHSKDYDWGIEDEVVLNKFLEDNPTIDDVYALNLKELQGYDTIGPSIATKIKKLAAEIVKGQKEKSSSGSVINPTKLLDHTPSKKERKEIEAREAVKEEDDVEYVLHEKPVDKFYTRRTRIRIGPATCRECGFDVIKVNNLPDYDTLNDVDKSAIQRTLKEHINKFHGNPSGKRVITGAEMRQTNWEHPEILR